MNLWGDAQEIGYYTRIQSLSDTAADIERDTSMISQDVGLKFLENCLYLLLRIILKELIVNVLILERIF